MRRTLTDKKGDTSAVSIGKVFIVTLICCCSTRYDSGFQLIVEGNFAFALVLHFYAL